MLSILWHQQSRVVTEGLCTVTDAVPVITCPHPVSPGTPSQRPMKRSSCAGWRGCEGPARANEGQLLCARGSITFHPHKLTADVSTLASGISLSLSLSLSLSISLSLLFYASLTFFHSLSPFLCVRHPPSLPTPPPPPSAFISCLSFLSHTSQFRMPLAFATACSALTALPEGILSSSPGGVGGEQVTAASGRHPPPLGHLPFPIPRAPRGSAPCP